MESAVASLLPIVAVWGLVILKEGEIFVHTYQIFMTFVKLPNKSYIQEWIFVKSMKVFLSLFFKKTVLRYCVI